MPIRLRFLLVANAFLVGLGIVGFVAITNLDRASDRFAEASHQSIDHVALSDQLRTNIPDLRALELQYVMTSSSDGGVALLAKMDARRKSLRQVMSHYHQEGKGGASSSCALCHRTSGQAITAVSYEPAALTSDALGGVAGQVVGQNSLQGCVSCHQAFKRFLQEHNQIRLLASQGRREEALATFQESEGQYTALLNEAEAFRQAQYAIARQESLEGHAAGDTARNTLVATFVIAAVVTFLVGHHFSGYIHRRLALLREGTRRVMRGELNQPIRMQGKDEFAELALAFNTMTGSLQASHAENVRLHDAAIQMREERIALLSDGLRRATEAQESERKRVARELHDEVGQALTGLQFGLGRMANMTRSPRLRKSAETLKELTVETLKGVRSLALDLRPSLLDELGLAATLHNYAGMYTTRTGLPVQLSISGLGERLRPELEITLFRIVQEALTNTARYADASHVWVDLAMDDGLLRLTVRDDGRGFDVEATRADYRKCLGISGMEERCRFSHGALGIESTPGTGTTIVCIWHETPDFSLTAARAAPPSLSGSTFAATGTGGGL